MDIQRNRSVKRNGRRMNMDKRRIKEIVIKYIKKQEEMGGSMTKRLVIWILITLLSMVATIVAYRSILMFIISL